MSDCHFGVSPINYSDSYSEQRGEVSNTILCTFSRGNQRIGEGVTIPNSLREEVVFLNVRTSIECLKCQRGLISTTPTFEDEKVIYFEQEQVGIIDFAF